MSVSLKVIDTLNLTVFVSSKSTHAAYLFKVAGNQIGNGRYDKRMSFELVSQLTDLAPVQSAIDSITKPRSTKLRVFGEVTNLFFTNSEGAWRLYVAPKAIDIDRLTHCAKLIKDMGTSPTDLDMHCFV